MPYDNGVLAQIGLVGVRPEKSKGDEADRRRDDDGNVAIRALRFLIESGKVSIDDAKLAIRTVRVSKDSTTKTPATAATKDKVSASVKNGTNGQKNNKDNNRVGTTSGGNDEVNQNKKRGLLRRRHIALQFSYDGTEFTGFAENLRRGYDDSVEKTLFAAMEKACLLVEVPPERKNGMLVVNEIRQSDKLDGMMTMAAVGNNDDNDKDEQILTTNKDNGKQTTILNESKRKEEGGPKSSKKPKNYLKARTASQYSRCGRTDRGVHANGQLVALYLKSAFPLAARKVGEPSTTTSMEVGEEGMTGNNGSSVASSSQPGDLLQEESLPNNSLDGLDCLVPLKKRAKKGKGNGNSNNNNNNSNNNDDDSTAPLQRKTITEYDYPRILNNILPPSIRILGWCPVSPEFSARFSCSKRTYRYFFPRRNLQLAAMAEGLQYMMGRHDFRNFCKMNCEQVINFERTLVSGRVASPQESYSVEMGQSWPTMEQNDDMLASIASPHDMCHVEIVGNAFLWHQVRCIVSVLFNIGRQLEAPTIVQQLLDVKANPAKPSYEMASESGLVLHDCAFRHLTLGRTVRNLWGATKALERRWELHAVAAERASDALESVKSHTEVRWTDLADFVEQIARDRMRKEKKRARSAHPLPAGDNDGEEMERIGRALDDLAPETAMVSWASAIRVVRDVLGVHPYMPNGSGQGAMGKNSESSLHVPFMERSKGTTYEEKVKSILSLACGTKRKERYEENIVKKRKTEEEDKAFYDHMLRQGGSSV